MPARPSLSSSTPTSAPPSTPALYVATNLESFAAPTANFFARDVVVDGRPFRELDPPYWAWLFSKLDQARRSCEAGSISRAALAVLLARWVAIQAWATRWFSASELQGAIGRLAGTTRLDSSWGSSGSASRSSSDRSSRSSSGRSSNRSSDHAGRPSDDPSIAPWPASSPIYLPPSVPAEHTPDPDTKTASPDHPHAAEEPAVQPVRPARRQPSPSSRRSSPASLPTPSPFPPPHSQGIGPHHHPVSPDALALVDSIRDEAVALGWTVDGLLRNRGPFRFPYGGHYGLACFLEPGDRIASVTPLAIAIVGQGSSPHSRSFYNRAIAMPWVRDAAA